MKTFKLNLNVLLIPTSSVALSYKNVKYQKLTEFLLILFVLFAYSLIR